jgi:hypothetical protein
LFSFKYLGNPKQPNVKQPGYGDAQYERIVAETGDRYELKREMR